jgi:hypothetical protein
LNLLRTSRLHPQLSAAAHFHGLVDYNNTDFAPPGCKIIAQKKPGNRRTWAPHGQHGYSLGPTMHHYRCQNVYISSTASERIVDTLEFLPHNYQMPQLSSTNRLTPSQHLLNWLQFSNSNYYKLHLPCFRLRLQRSHNEHALLNHTINSQPIQCPLRDKRDLKEQFTHKTSPTRHHLRGWSHLGRLTRHIQGCPLALGDSLPATCPKMTSAQWTPPTWPSPSETTIGLSDTKQTLSSTPSPGKK